MSLKGRHPSRRPRSRWEQDVRRHITQEEVQWTVKTKTESFRSHRTVCTNVKTPKKEHTEG